MKICKKVALLSSLSSSISFSEPHPSANKYLFACSNLCNITIKMFSLWALGRKQRDSHYSSVQVSRVKKRGKDPTTKARKKRGKEVKKMFEQTFFWGKFKLTFLGCFPFHPSSSRLFIPLSSSSSAPFWSRKVCIFLK
jgi:hypothetical protein